MPKKLLIELADGRIHSGEKLGLSLGISRAAICKQVKKLNESGRVVDCIKGAGYRLLKPIELLELEAITANLTQESRDLLSKIEILWSIPSTNSYCMEALKIFPLKGYVCLAEHQVAGRGRRGRSWVSAPCEGLCMSLVWQFTGDADVLDGLSLAVAVVVADILRNDFFIEGVKLKWPNDIFVRDAKLGGILIEVVGEIGGIFSTVIGLGLNVGQMNVAENSISQPWTDMESLLGKRVSRNKLAASILNKLVHMFEMNLGGGFNIFCDEWRKYDALLGRRVVVQSGADAYFEGVAMGISDSGEFLLDVGGAVRAFKSGEVSLRYV